MYIKSSEDIKAIEEAGKRMGEVLHVLEKMIKPGISAWDVNQKADELIHANEGKPAFKGYRARKSDPPFPSTICASINEEVVHGIATKEKVLRDGDIFSIDIGMWFFHRNQKSVIVDTALTVCVGDVNEKTKELVRVTKKALEIGIAECIVGNTVADIGQAIEQFVLPQGYGIVRDLVGHGVGHKLHEEPRVPNYYEKELENWKLEPGVVLALEPMLTMGSHDVVVADDGWSISTQDKSLSAHFEHTVVITADGPIVATRRPGE
jgi:methionyl aminopeptidase